MKTEEALGRINRWVHACKGDTGGRRTLAVDGPSSFRKGVWVEAKVGVAVYASAKGKDLARALRKLAEKL